MNQPPEPKIIVDQLAQFARAHLLAAGAPLEPHTSLSDAGIDSFAMVELLLFSERAWGIPVPESHLTRQNLASLAALAQCIAGLAQATSAPSAST